MSEIILDKSNVLLEGKVRVSRQALMLPLECRDKAGCSMNQITQLVGSVVTETGGSNIAVVERFLERLNGKHIRLTIEWNEEQGKE